MLEMHYSTTNGCAQIEKKHSPKHLNKFNFNKIYFIVWEITETTLNIYLNDFECRRYKDFFMVTMFR